MQKSINVFANEAQKAISVERYDSRPFIAPLKVGSSGRAHTDPMCTKSAKNNRNNVFVCFDLVPDR